MAKAIETVNDVRGYARKDIALYDKPGKEGEFLRDVYSGTEVTVVESWHQGRWARVRARGQGGFTDDGFVKSKYVTLHGTDARLDDYLGYTGYRDGSNYGSTIPERIKPAEKLPVVPAKIQSRKLKATWSCERAEDVLKTEDEKIESAVERAVSERMTEPLVPEKATEAMNRLATVIENKEEPLEEPGRTRLAFLDRLCAWREHSLQVNSTPNEQVAKISEARYKFASTLVRWGAGAYAVSQVVPYVAGIFTN